MVHTKAVPEMTAFDCYREVMDMTSEGLLREAEALRESVLAGGSAVYAYTAMRWLEEHRG